MATQPELTTMPTNPTEHRSSHVKQVLDEAAKDLDNAELPLGFISNPIRDLLARPSLQVASAVLPAVTNVLPFTDELTAFSLSLPFNAARFGYCIIHPDERKTIVQDAQAGIQELSNMNIDKLKEDPLIVRAKADLMGLKAHFIAAIIEIISDPNSKLSEWNEATCRLAAYVENIGLGDELRRAIVTSDANIRIIGHVQAGWDNELTRRQKTFMSNPPQGQSLHEIAKLMRYSTAAFGEEIMDAQHCIAGKDGEPKKSVSLVGSEALKVKVCEHVGIPTSSITSFCMGPGGSMKLLRHFIAIDDDLQAVVLAIRGTASLSGWVIDFQGMGRPFCDGIAHAGMADMADAIVKNSKSEILRALNLNPTYKLLITGESLGGGVAPLVNLVCHTDTDISKFKIHASPFAGPPVYFQTSPNPKVEKAIQNCTAYIHRDDVVAHCSVSSVQRLLAKIHAVDEVAKKMNPIDKELIASGRKLPTKDLINAVLLGDSNVPLLDGAPKLYMPASSVVWFCPQTKEEGKSDSCKYNMMVCDAKKIADLGIPLTIDMFSDHPPYVYETALNEIEITGWDVISPPQFKDVGGSVAAFV